MSSISPFNNFEIILFEILPYVSNKISFAGLNKKIRTLVLHSDTCDYWKNTSFEICIDSYCCPGCSLKRRGANVNGALRVISQFPYRQIKMHCFITDIPKFLLSLGSRGCVESLHLTLTNKANSPPLSELLSTDLSPNMFTNLYDLTLDSSHLNYVKPAGRIRLLQILGQNLLSLSFIGLSPSRMFQSLNELCPKLERLRVDRAHSLEDFEFYHSASLKHLELCRANFTFKNSIQFPNLISLRFTPSCRCEISQIETMIQCLPAISLVELCMEVPSDNVSQVVTLIASSLINLRRLKLEGSYTDGDISEEAMVNLCDGCIHLQTFEITSRQTVTAIHMSPAAVRALGSFPALTSVRVMYEDFLLDELLLALAQTKSITEVVMWERKRWCNVAWGDIQKRMLTVMETFLAVRITLEDISGCHQHF